MHEEVNTPATTAHDSPSVRVLRSAVADYRYRAQYPSYAYPLRDGQDPIRNAREVSPAKARGENDEDPELTVSLEEPGLELPEPAVVLAYLTENGSRIAAQEIVGTVLDQDMQPVADIAFHADPSRDLVYTASFTPDKEQTGELARTFLIRVRVIAPEGQIRTATTSLTYNNPLAHLTGNYRDSVINGSLVIEAELEAVAAGRFHIEATLYSADALHPLAWAQSAAELQSGRHWMALEFYGLILRQRAIDGPYLLRFVALSTTGVFPNARNHIVTDAFVTKPYLAMIFTDQPFNNEEFLNAADRIETQIAGTTP